MKKLWARLQAALSPITSLHVGVYAAHTGFFMVLSVFPMLVLLMSLLRYTGISVDTLTDLLEGVIPKALMGGAKRLILNTYQSTTGTVLSLSALTALWSASRGIHGLRTGLNLIYEVANRRGYWYTRLFSVIYTLLFLAVLLLTLVLHIFGTGFLDWLLRFLPYHPALTVLENIVDWRFFVLLAVQTALFTGMFCLLPNRHCKISEALPGAVFSSAGWLIFTHLYSVYVEHFTGMANIYGSIYAVALSLLWLYFCMCIFFYGGALNQWLYARKAS